MKLLELVAYFRNGGSYQDFCSSQSLDISSEVIEVYMEKTLHLDNDLAFFEIEKTDGKSEYIFKQVRYLNLFDFYYFLDTIEESHNDENNTLTDLEVANVLFSYARDDS
jgi:hypothetical protein